MRWPRNNGHLFLRDGALRRSLGVKTPFMKPGMLQINKELQKDDVVDLIDQPRLAVVECLHLIADIHIEVFRKLVIHAEKQSVLIES